MSGGHSPGLAPERDALPLPGGAVRAGASAARRRELIQKFAAFAGLMVLIVVFSITSRAFMTINNGLTVSLQVTSIGILGVGMTCVIITGGIDLSVGSILALAGVCAALAVQAGLPVWLGMAFGILVGLVCGVLNGLVVTRMRLPPFIATLAMMMVARGVALQITGARAVSGVGQGFGVLGNGSLFRVQTIGPDGFPDVAFPGIPYPVIIMVALMVLVSLLLTRTVLGRHIYAVGSNSEAARLSGVDVRRVTLFAYALSGTLAGLTGCILMSRLVTGQPNEGVGYELDAIAGAVIGGTSLIGGIGTISGTAIGAFIIGVLRNGLNMNGISAFTQEIIIGLVILFTVWIDQLRNRR